MLGRIFVTGASGFVGSAVIKELRSRSYTVNALVNRKDLDTADDGVRSIKGGLFDSAALKQGLEGCQAVIHLVGIIMETPSRGVTFDRIHRQGTQAIVEATKRAGIKRYIHMSALGVGPDAPSNYHRTKYQAEDLVRHSGLDWTIFRPSLIHGPQGEFMKLEAKWARKKAPPFLFMPYFGAGAMGFGGAGKLQPVFVNDIARAFVDAIENPKTIGEIYPIAGPHQLTWPDLHHISAHEIVGHRRFVAAIPVWYAKLLTHFVPACLLPFNRDQVVMSQENNTADLSKFKDSFGWDPQPFGETLKEYAKQL
jgi:uncharacterized protein YbjT (DUF2867 family)